MGNYHGNGIVYSKQNSSDQSDCTNTGLCSSSDAGSGDSEGSSEKSVGKKERFSSIIRKNSKRNGHDNPEKAENDCLKQLFQKLESQSEILEPHLPEHVVARAVFETAFDGPLHVFGRLLFEAMTQYSGKEHMARDEFMKQGRLLMNIVRPAEVDLFYFTLFASGKSAINAEDLSQLVEDSYAIAIAEAQMTYQKSQHDDELLQAIIKGILSYRDNITFEDFGRWRISHCTHFFEAVHTFVLSHLTVQKRVRHPALKRRSSVPRMCPSDRGHNLSLAMLWILSSVLPPSFTDNACQSPEEEDPFSFPPLTFPSSRLSVPVKRLDGWTRLYSSDTDGLSFTRFQRSVIDYRGSTCLFVGMGPRQLFCIALDEEWRDGTERIGGEDCMVLKMLHTYRVVASGTKIVLLNSRNRDLPRGIAVGSDPNNLIIHINHTFDKVVSYQREYPLTKIEVWGCAGQVVREAQIQQQVWEHEQIIKMKECGKSRGNWEHTPDRMLLEWGGVRCTYSDSLR